MSSALSLATVGAFQFCNALEFQFVGPHDRYVMRSPVLLERLMHGAAWADAQGRRHPTPRSRLRRKKKAAHYSQRRATRLDLENSLPI
jgi:hypothetical protein